MISLNPPDEPSVKLDTAVFQPFDSQYLVYILYRSPAKMAASSPPVPPRISITTFLLSSGSAGISSSLISSSIGAICGSISSISARAISFISGSCSLAKMSLASFRLFNKVSYRFLAVSTRSRSRYSLLSLTKRFMSAITAGSVIKVDTSSNLCWSPSNLLSNVFSAILFVVFLFFLNLIASFAFLSHIIHEFVHSELRQVPVSSLGDE